MKSIFLLGAAAFSTINLSAQKSESYKQKMNVLFIAVDDLKPLLGCYGDPIAKTPNIDRLAQRGTMFLSNYCQQAVSGPTRASLMTGLRPDHTKVWDLKTRMRDVNPDILSLPQYFSLQGYNTMGIGKIYDGRCVDQDADKPSWTIPFYKARPEDFYNQQTPAILYYQDSETRKKADEITREAKKNGLSGGSKYVMSKLKPSSECVDVPNNAYTDGANAKRVKEILTELSKDKTPFFFAVGFDRPHLPFNAPRKYWDLYERDRMPLAKFKNHAKNSPEIAYHNSGELRTYSDIPPLTSFTDINRIGLPLEKEKELIHGYYACVSYTDALIGSVLNTLDSLGMSRNTIVVLWGDHGWHLGDHDLWNKHTNFEQATRTPMIFAVPGQKAQKIHSLSEFVDIFPTLCDLAGLSIPSGLDGTSLVPLMKNAKSKVKEYSVSQYPRENDCMGYSIRTERYRLTFWMRNGFRSTMEFDPGLIIAKELYDYRKDPLETINVIENKAYAKDLRTMEKHILAFFRSQAPK